jgi:hypothetical protein
MDATGEIEKWHWSGLPKRNANEHQMWQNHKCIEDWIIYLRWKDFRMIGKNIRLTSILLQCRLSASKQANGYIAFVPGRRSTATKPQITYRSCAELDIESLS